MKAIVIVFGLVIGLIGCIMIILGKWNLEGWREGFLDVDVDHIEYGAPTAEITTLTKRQITSFPTPLPLSNVTPPPKNSSQTTITELKYLSGLTPTDEQKQFATTLLKRDAVVNMFIKYAGENGLTYSDELLRKANTDVETFSLQLKLVYNRPRPSQLAFVHQVNLNIIGNPTSPSYPSTETMQARVLQGLLVYNNPKAADQLAAIAKKIELAQLYGGLTFPSDNSAANQIADVILKHIKYLEL